MSWLNLCPCKTQNGMGDKVNNIKNLSPIREDSGKKLKKKQTKAGGLEKDIKVMLNKSY